VIIGALWLAGATAAQAQSPEQALAEQPALILAAFASAAATKAAIAKDKVPPGGPLAFFRGVETDLAEICIGPK
jgi:hypothetical protein